MIRALSIAAAVAALALAAPAGATIPYESFRMPPEEQQRMLSAEYERCLDESGGVTVNIRDCATAEDNRLDTLLNASYRAAMARLPDQPARQRLRTLERRWLATRWNECDREAAAEGGGTMALLIFDACALDEVVRRIAWLDRYGR